MKDIPQSIKDAADSIYNTESCIQIYDDSDRHGAFITGATHPDTEKYYREKLCVEIHDEICADFGILTGKAAENFQKQMENPPVLSEEEKARYRKSIELMKLIIDKSENN